MARRTKEDAEKTKQELMASALKLFSEKGVSRTTLTDIAKGAGVTKGAFYWHFKDKFEILHALRIKFTAEFDSVSAIDMNAADYGVEQFFYQFEAILGLLNSSPDLFNFYRVCVLKCEFTDELKEFVELDVIETKRWQAEVEESLVRLPSTAWQNDVEQAPRLLANVICDYLSGYVLSKAMDNSALDPQSALNGLKMICRGGGLII